MKTALGFAIVAVLNMRNVYCSYYHGPTAKPVVLHNGYLADTHEVAAAKNAHLAALAKESHHGGDYGYGHGQEYSGSYDGHHGDIRYHGPTAKPVVLHNGYLADTHEVAAAKNAHLAALAKESHYGGDYGYGHGQEYSGSYDGHHGDSRYHGPTTIPHVLHDGHIADTHEVAAAKAEHFAAVAKAKAHGGYGDHYSGNASDYGTDHGHSHHVAPYHGPLAKPVVLKSGYLADTHEVAAAREYHLQAFH
ncbi:cation channel sperm-associated protein 1-like [Macrosteles quadrilineatus]|uniref:cation channel sperm-associated protein 1-like n=1 Tax=Macrosteles quadrilineatus TaxID=74068 RepID=UPI0023E21D44|nr:cation channel sperm-associated protein 1-like [Macrosteles quadrilineatus]